MKKLFISQPMAGRTYEEIVNERKSLISYVRVKINEDVDALATYFGDIPDCVNPLECLGKSIEILSGADIAVFANGWQDARGCRIERTAAFEYGIPIVEVYTDAV